MRHCVTENKGGLFCYYCSIYFIVITMTNWRSRVTATLGIDVNYALLHHSSCVPFTSDPCLNRRERTVDKLRRNDDASVTTLFSRQKARRCVRSACFPSWHTLKYFKDAEEQETLLSITQYPTKGERLYLSGDLLYQQKNYDADSNNYKSAL
jgi:hypothetical protein